MNTLELKQVFHQYKIGDKCLAIEPNINEDTLFISNGIPVGFFIKKLPEKIEQYIKIADREFRSNNVPKTVLDRVDTVALSKQLNISRKEARELGGVSQYSTIIGSIPPNAVMRRNYSSISTVHREQKAKNFIKAMLLASKEASILLKKIMPEQYEKQKKLLLNVDKQWHFGELFTSSISNFNIAAPYHIDTRNIHETINIIITKRHDSKGGNLHIPDYNAVINQCDNSMLVYPAWKSLHGVTPIEKLSPDGYRNSFVFYALNAFIGV